MYNNKGNVVFIFTVIIVLSGLFFGLNGRKWFEPPSLTAAPVGTISANQCESVEDSLAETPAKFIATLDIDRRELTPEIMERYPDGKFVPRKIHNEAWTVGEHLEFEITYSIYSAGTATMSVLDVVPVNGGNCYHGQMVKAGPDGQPVSLPRGPGFVQTGRNWPIVPRALYWGPKFFHEKHPDIPIIVSENGMSNADYVSSDGKCHDPQRVEFIKQYLGNLKRAVDEGVPILGYMHWSILDSMEWMFGYNYRFGLIHTDFETFKRTPKDSAEYYSKVIATNGECLDE